MDNFTSFSGMENDTAPNATAGPDGTVAPALDTAADDYAAYCYYIAERLFIIVDPFITFGGLIGNLLMLGVMLRAGQRRMGISTFIAALALTDSVVLVLDFINNWFKYELKIYLMGMNAGFCVFHRFFFNVAYTFSSWLVVSISVERFIAVVFPFKAKIICTVRNALITIVCIFLAIFFYYFYNIWAWHIDADGKCSNTAEWESFMNVVAAWMSGALYSYIPIVALIVLNAMIIVKLTTSRRRLGEHCAAGLDDSVNRQVTVSVVTICVTFLVLTLPLAIFYIVQFAAGQYIYQGPEMAIAETLVLIFGLSNHAVNCLLYILSSQKFRQELVTMMHLGRFIKLGSVPGTSNSSAGKRSPNQENRKPPYGKRGTDSSAIDSSS